jgi:hypothetical protein
VTLVFGLAQVRGDGFIQRSKRARTPHEPLQMDVIHEHNQM